MDQGDAAVATLVGVGPTLDCDGDAGGGRRSWRCAAVRLCLLLSTWMGDRNDADDVELVDTLRVGLQCCKQEQSQAQAPASGL